MSPVPLPPPPPPVPPSLSGKIVPAPPPAPKVAQSGPPGCFMVELLAFNGAPFKDHWAYFVRSHADDDMGVVLHATGDVMNGFRLEIKRSHDLAVDVNRPTSRIPLQWVDGKYFEEQKMLNYGLPKFDDMPFCDFEASAFKVRPPGPTLNRVNVNTVGVPDRITQRNCQTWIVESADQLVVDHIFSPEVAQYLHSVEQ